MSVPDATVKLPSFTSTALRKTTYPAAQYTHPHCEPGIGDTCARPCCQVDIAGDRPQSSCGFCILFLLVAFLNRHYRCLLCH